MSEAAVEQITSSVSNLGMEDPNVINNNKVDECEAAEEAVTTDSEEYLAETLRYRNFQFSSASNDSTVTLTSQYIMEENDNNYLSDIKFNHIEIPIVGYEVMEERARFTVYKLKIENKLTGECWFVFRRYTDFVRLCNKLKSQYPHIVRYLPRKKWLGNNFNPIFLEDRLNGLQTLVNAILRESELVNLESIQDFFCLNEPPTYRDVDQESGAVFDALEESMYKIRKQLEETELKVEELQAALGAKSIENENLKKVIKNSTVNCPKCSKEFDNLTKNLHSAAFSSQSINSPVSSTSSD